MKYDTASQFHQSFCWTIWQSNLKYGTQIAFRPDMFDRKLLINSIFNKRLEINRPNCIFNQDFSKASFGRN